MVSENFLLTKNLHPDWFLVINCKLVHSFAQVIFLEIFLTHRVVRLIVIEVIKSESIINQAHPIHFLLSLW